ncbi:MAG: hypothetical protein WA322_12710 [Pseudolabrys sp.]
MERDLLKQRIAAKIISVPDGVERMAADADASIEHAALIMKLI